MQVYILIIILSCYKYAYYFCLLSCCLVAAMKDENNSNFINLASEMEQSL